MNHFRFETLCSKCLLNPIDFSLTNVCPFKLYITFRGQSLHSIFRQSSSVVLIRCTVNCFEPCNLSSF